MWLVPYVNEEGPINLIDYFLAMLRSQPKVEEVQMKPTIMSEIIDVIYQYYYYVIAAEVILVAVMVSLIVSCMRERSVKQLKCNQQRNSSSNQSLNLQTCVFNPTPASNTSPLATNQVVSQLAREGRTRATRPLLDNYYFRYGTVQSPPMYEPTMRIDTWIKSSDRYANAIRICKRQDVLMSPECADAVDHIGLNGEEDEAYEELKDILIK
jgi:hypothetical protein